MVPRTRDDVRELEHSFKEQETLFHCEEAEHWYRLPWEVEGSPTLERFKSHLGMVMVALLEQGKMISTSPDTLGKNKLPSSPVIVELT